MVKPYYQDETVTIYHGDCREVLPLLPKVDLVLTDPPYGIGKDGQKFSTGKHGGRKAYDFMGWDAQRPSAEIFQLILKASLNQIIWGGNYFADLLPATSGWLVWDKGQRINQSDGELAWTSFQGALRIWTMNRVELLTEGAAHPTQKPTKLIQLCVLHVEGQIKPTLVNTILDPFMGSGTTLKAAKLLGKQAIGIEIEERYCEIAAKRCESIQAGLFDVPIVVPNEIQTGLFGEAQ